MTKITSFTTRLPSDVAKKLTILGNTLSELDPASGIARRQGRSGAIARLVKVAPYIDAIEALLARLETEWGDVWVEQKVSEWEGTRTRKKLARWLIDNDAMLETLEPERKETWLATRINEQA